MRILYFSRDYTPHDYRFLNSLAGTKHEIFSMRLERGPRQLEDRPLPPAVRQVTWMGGRKVVGWRDYPALCLNFRQVIRDIRPDLVHAGPVPTVAFLAALSGFQPLVSASWGSDLLRDVDHDHWQRRAARYTLNRSKVLIGDCQAVKQKAGELGFPGERVVLFPWGVDLDQFSPALSNEPLRARFGWEQEFVLLSVRGWEPVYGIDVIARAFVRAAQAAPNIRLVLLGGGSQATLIREIFERGGVRERVFYAGQVANTLLPGYYQAADLYISATHSDGSSVSLMEALASGKPVLVSDIPGNCEWLENSPAGWLFPDGDDQALAEGILRAARQKVELTRMGQAARRLAESRADWQKNFRQLLFAYEMALNS